MTLLIGANRLLRYNQCHFGVVETLFR